MMQGMKQCVCLYTEEEFKQLVIEAHYTCRYHFYSKDNRRWSWCLYCHVEFNDKNALSYHRHMDQCASWKELRGESGAVLKMYPMFNQSDSKLVASVLRDAGLKFPAPPELRPWAPKTETHPPDSATLNDKNLTQECATPKVKKVTQECATPKDKNIMEECAAPKDKKSTQKEGKRKVKFSAALVEDSLGQVPAAKCNTKKTKSRVREDMEVAEATNETFTEDCGSDHELRIGSGIFKRLKRQSDAGIGGNAKKTIDYEDDEEQPNFQLQFRHEGRSLTLPQMLFTDEEGVLPSATGCTDLDLNKSTDPVLEELDYINVLEELVAPAHKAISMDVSGAPTHVTREAVYAAAQQSAESICAAELPGVGQSPPIRIAPGLYYLVAKSPVEIVDKTLLISPDACMKALHVLEREETLSDKLMAALGPWIHWTRAQLAAKDKKGLVHLSTMAWNPYVSCPDMVGRQQELLKLSSYLKYLVEQSEYDAMATTAIKLARENHIQRALKEFDLKEQIETENREWAWSPLFQALLQDLPKSAPPRPWNHTEEEFVAVIAALHNNMPKQETTLEFDCPHVVRVLTLYSCFSATMFTPISHPTLGATRHKLLEIARDNVESQRLVLFAQHMSEIGWTLFPCIRGDHVEPLSNCCQDVDSLIGADRVKQENVLAKIRSFFSRVAQRAILDLCRTQESYRQLSAMWIQPKSEGKTTSRDVCLQVFSTMLAVREDVDIGWAHLGVGKSTKSSKDMEDMEARVSAATKALQQLCEKGLEIAFEMLGYGSTDVPSYLERNMAGDRNTPMQQIPVNASDDNLVDFLGSQTRSTPPEQPMPASPGEVDTPTTVSEQPTPTRPVQLQTPSSPVEEPSPTSPVQEPVPISTTEQVLIMEVDDNVDGVSESSYEGRSIPSLYEVMTKRINDELGHGQPGCLEFIFEKGSTILWSDPDMLALDDDHGKLSSHLMDFFCLWFQASVSPEILVCQSDFAIDLRALTNKTTKLNALREYVNQHFNVGCSNWSTLIVPVCDFEHWSLAVLSEQGFLKFDPGYIDNNNFHGPQKFHEALAKIWCMGTGHIQGSLYWKRACDIGSWVHVKCPQQKDVWSCGYYVISYMMMYTKYVKQLTGTALLGDMQEVFEDAAVLEIKEEVKDAILSVVLSKQSTTYRCRSDVRILEPL